MIDLKKVSKQIDKKIKAFDTKLKTSFILIRQDLDDMQISLDAMRTYLKKKDTEFQNQNTYNTKAQNKINSSIEEFEEKIAKLKLAISQMNAIKAEVVLRKDLSKIEERIKNSFAKEIKKYQNKTDSLREQLKETSKRITALEKGQVYEKKSLFTKLQEISKNKSQ